MRFCFQSMLGGGNQSHQPTNSVKFLAKNKQNFYYEFADFFFESKTILAFQVRRKVICKDLTGEIKGEV